MAQDNKAKSIRVGQYLVSKAGAKYLKFENAKNKDGSPKTDIFPLTINEGDILFVDLYDDEFREKYNVPDFVRGTLAQPIVALPVGNTKAKAAITEDEF